MYNNIYDIINTSQSSENYDSSGIRYDTNIVTNEDPKSALRKTSKFAKPASLVGENRYDDT